MKENNLNYEEFMKMIEECYGAFGDVLKICDIDKKRAAIQGIKTLEQIVREHVLEIGEEEEIDLKKLDNYLKSTDYALFKEGKDAKQRFERIKDELEPLLHGFSEERSQEKSKKSRKRKMENKMRAKE